MGRIGMPELLIVLFIVLIVIGGTRLPQLGKGIGAAIRNFRSGMKDDSPDNQA